MAESGGSVSIDMETIPFGGQECVVETSRGPVSVFICGDQEKPAMVTYPDVALNYMSCFQGLFFCPDADSLILQNFCIYHINAPGLEFLQSGAAAIPSDVPSLGVGDLADQVAEVLDFFGVKKVMCLGALAGAYILTLFAMKYRERAVGLIVVSPLCRAPSWTEWFYNKEVRCGIEGEKSYTVQACRRLLDDTQSSNVIRYLRAMNKRSDLTEGLKELQCKTLIFVGENSPFYSEALHMNEMMDSKSTDFVEIQACGSLVTEEQPDAMLVPLELFLKGFGFYRQPSMTRISQHAGVGRLPSASACIPRELLSPEGLGIKLKPIKTRVPIEV